MASLKRADTALTRQQKQRDDCRVELGTVLAMIGSETVEAAQARVALAQEHAQMAEAVRRGERDLHEKGDGRPMAQLRSEIASIPVDEIPGAIEAVQAEHDAANRDAQALAARVATTSAEMAQQAQADTATQAATDQQARRLRRAATHHRGSAGR